MESEYGGGGVMPNGIFPQEDGVELSPSDQLMLMSATGSTTDSHAPVDPYYWHGNVKPATVVKKPKPKRITEAQRYKESQY